MTARTPFARALGAAPRAAVMALLVALPQLILGAGSEAAGQVVALFALLAFAFTAMEYAAPAPSLVEFRDAPPFNRIRVVALFLSVAATSLVLRAHGLGGAPDPVGPGTAELLLRALAARLGEALDRPFLPVRLLMSSLGEHLQPAQAAALRAAAGLSYMASLLMALAFVLMLRLRRWPSTRRFNVWINLPQFDPTAGGDVVGRLSGEANLNLSLGILLPFVVPVVAGFLQDPFDGAVLSEPTALAWLVTAWAFLPASLLMRGVALHRVAAMIAAQRARAGLEGSLQPA